VGVRSVFKTTEQSNVQQFTVLACHFRRFEITCSGTQILCAIG
jgi:hypothetical protein